MKTYAIILAGGSGIRFNSEIPKQFVKIAGKLIIEHTIEVFEKHPLINGIIIVINPEYYNRLEEIVQNNAYRKVKKILNGGENRQESSKIGVFACDEDVDKVLFHDAVRPFVSEGTITNIISLLDKYSAIDVAIPVSDTIIKINKEKFIEDIPDRKCIYRGQTPQGFSLKLIKKAHELALNDNYIRAPDDCSLILKYNLSKIFVIEDSEFNIKITYPLDIHIADKIFQVHKINLGSIAPSDVLESVKNKVIVIFGGNSGIGLEIFNLCRKMNADVYQFSRSNGVDIRNYSDVSEALTKVYKMHKKIDCIICSAGILKLNFIETADIDEIKDQIDVNFLGNILVAKASIPYLKQTKGHLLFFASSSYTRGRSGYTPYSASKAALVNFVQGLSDEVSQYSIKVNVVNPERTDTPLRRNNFGKEDKSILLSPQYVAYATMKILATDINGAVIEVRKQDEKEFGAQETFNK